MALLTPRLPDTCSNYYELLGLQPFEQDAGLIDGQVRELLREARKYQVGRYSVQAEKHLNLLAEARACLLDAVHKTHYDEELRRQWELPPVSVASTFVATPVPVASGDEFATISSSDRPFRSKSLVSRARRTRRRAQFVAVSGTVVLFVALGVLGVWLVASRSAGGPVSLGEALRQAFQSLTNPSVAKPPSSEHVVPSGLHGR